MKTKRIVNVFLLVLVVAFIFGQSVVSVEQSSAESRAFTEFLLRIFDGRLTEAMPITHALVRKCAHCFEFAVLGIVLSTLVLQREKRLASLLRTFSFGVGIALLDETIQIFSGRGSEVRDVWIDALGVCIGTIAAFVIMLLAEKIKAKKAE